MALGQLLSPKTILTNIGIALLLHASYYNLNHHSNEVEKIKENTPFNVLLEVMIGFICCLIGRMIAIGPFLEISASSPSKLELVAPVYRTRDFDIFNNRRKCI